MGRDPPLVQGEENGPAGQVGLVIIKLFQKGKVGQEAGTRDMVSAGRRVFIREGCEVEGDFVAMKRIEGKPGFLYPADTGKASGFAGIEGFGDLEGDLDLARGAHFP